MNKPIIIDGVDVSECENYSPLEYLQTNNGYDENPDYCSNYIDHICVNHSNCYYKQLQRLKAENEELKKRNEELDKMTGIYSHRLMKRYKQALEEVRKSCIDYAKTEAFVIDETFVEFLEHVFIKIREVLKDE